MVKDITGLGRVEILTMSNSRMPEINSILEDKPFKVDVNKTVGEIESEFASNYPQLKGWFPLFEFKYSNNRIYATDKDAQLCDTINKLASCGLKMQICRSVK